MLVTEILVLSIVGLRHLSQFLCLSSSHVLHLWQQNRTVAHWAHKVLSKLESNRIWRKRNKEQTEFSTFVLCSVVTVFILLSISHLDSQLQSLKRHKNLKLVLRTNTKNEFWTGPLFIFVLLKLLRASFNNQISLVSLCLPGIRSLALWVLCWMMQLISIYLTFLLFLSNCFSSTRFSFSCCAASLSTWAQWDLCNAVYACNRKKHHSYTFRPFCTPAQVSETTHGYRLIQLQAQCVHNAFIIQ